MTPDTLTIGSKIATPDQMVDAAVDALLGNSAITRNEIRSWAVGTHFQDPEKAITLINVPGNDGLAGIVVEASVGEGSPTVRFQVDMPGVAKAGDKKTIQELGGDIALAYQQILSDRVS